MAVEEIIVEAMKYLGPAGVGAIATAIIFFKFYKKSSDGDWSKEDKVVSVNREGNGGGNGKAQCPLHSTIETRLSSGDENFKSICDDIADLRISVGRIDERTKILVEHLPHTL